MKRLPPPAALLLLFVVVWFCQKSPKHGLNLDEVATRDQNAERNSHSPAHLTADLSMPASGKQEVPQQRKDESGTSESAVTLQKSGGIQITPTFVMSLAEGGESVSFPLPDGRDAQGIIEQRLQAADGSLAGVSGRLEAPGKGRFHFRLQQNGPLANHIIGAVIIENSEIAFRVLPSSAATFSLTAQPVDQVICKNHTLPPVEAHTPQEIFADPPSDVEIPSYQNGIISLQSRPGAEGVIYLDLDGEEGPHEGWGDFTALAPTGMTQEKIINIWTRVAEDFAPFKLNVTTDLQVFLNAPETSRQRCIITPSKNAAPTSGGVAYVGSFGWGGDTPCWCFYSSSAKYAAEIISHEIGHTLGLYHDGRTSAESYYTGHNSNLVGWAPIMGAGYYKNLTQWSKGEYSSANQSQDDIAIIAANPGVGLADDDAGDSHTSATPLEIQQDGLVHREGEIGTQSDIDAFTFTTVGGAVTLKISPMAHGPNLDIVAGIFDTLGNPILSDNPDLSLDATLSTTLVAGTYSLHVQGTGRGNSGVDGYSRYGSLGRYTIQGTIAGGMTPNHLVVTAQQTAESPIFAESLINEGTLVVSTSLNITGDATNHGVLRLSGDCALNITGTFTNYGVIDIINWNGTLPPSMIHNGTILDRSAHKVTTTATNSTHFSLSVPSFAGHLYQLESSDNPAGPWSPLGDIIPGTGDAHHPPSLQFTPDLNGPCRFYRVAIMPAP